jgi:hypothetical protein
VTPGRSLQSDHDATEDNRGLHYFGGDESKGGEGYNAGTMVIYTFI